MFKIFVINIWKIEQNLKKTLLKINPIYGIVIGASLSEPHISESMM